jgi:hypothetical protein
MITNQTEIKRSSYSEIPVSKAGQLQRLSEVRAGR